MRKCGRYWQHCTYLTHCRSCIISQYYFCYCKCIKILHFICPSVAYLPDEDRQGSIKTLRLLTGISVQDLLLPIVSQQQCDSQEAEYTQIV